MYHVQTPPLPTCIPPTSQQSTDDMIYGPHERFKDLRLFLAHLSMIEVENQS